ncbi:MAG: imidazolonepropionase [Erysipelotrichaceae bacterium]|nr:imidazolonepropionase [Erysipelotrichaceae bacterium]
MSIKLFTNIAKLYTMAGGVRKKDRLDDASIIEHAWMTVADGRVQEIGTGKAPFVDGEIIDCNNQIVLPGFIDAHTHLVYGGDRSNEYRKKMAGVAYLDILQAGGGIHATVEATRKATFEELYNKAKATLDYMLTCGVTTLEAKSGYGLDKDTEIKQLEVVKELQKDTPITLISSFLPAHARPKNYPDAHAFFTYQKNEVLPYVMEHHLAEYMDCFLETGVFNAEEAKEILQIGKDAGLKIKIHVDEIASIGGVDVACELGAVSVEHCMVTTEADSDKLAAHDITAVLLPATSFNLGSAYARAKMMLEHGVTLAVATDYNPGSCPCSDFLWMLRIASRGYKLTPNEVLSMATINAAKAIDRDHEIGSLEVGKQADFIVMNVASFDEVIANMQKNPITQVYKNGRKVV